MRGQDREAECLADRLGQTGRQAERQGGQAESTPRNQFPGSLNVYKYGLRILREYLRVGPAALPMGSSSLQYH